jgi:hypothetical protein
MLESGARENESGMRACSSSGASDYFTAMGSFTERFRVNNCG